MSALTFPSNPTNGELYPLSPALGQYQYQYIASTNTWVLVGRATGVTAGTYGSPSFIPVVTVNAAGYVTNITQVGIVPASLTTRGIVQLVNNTTSQDIDKALTAAQGKFLQDQINNITSGGGGGSVRITAGTGLGAPATGDVITSVGTLNLLPPTSQAIGGVKEAPNGGITINASGEISLNAATLTSIGGVKVGSNTGIAVDNTGVISLLPGNSTSLGGVKEAPGTGIDISSQGELSLLAPTTTSLGGVRQGVGLNITLDGVIGLNPASISEIGGIKTNSSVGLTVLGDGLLSLAGTNVVPGTYNNATVTVDAFGRITFASNGSGGGGSSTFNVSLAAIDNISAQFDGVRTTFNLTSGGAPLPVGLTEQSLFISLGGVVQYPGAAYTYNAGVITFAAAPLVSFSFSGRYLSLFTSSDNASILQVDNISSSFNGTTTTFPLTRGGTPLPPGINSTQLLIFLGGVLQYPGLSYTYTNGNLVFFTAPPSSFTFDARYLRNEAGNVASISIIDDIASQFNGVTTSFPLRTGGISLPATLTAPQLLISLGGVLQSPNSAYTYTNGTITFTTPPVNGYTFNGRYLSNTIAENSVFVEIDDISSQFNGTSTSFTLQTGGAALPANVNSGQLIISLGGVPQIPGQSYNFANSNISFTTPPPSGFAFSGRYYRSVGSGTGTGGGGGGGTGTGTVTSVTVGNGLLTNATNSIITTTGTISLAPASFNTIGGIRLGANTGLTLDGNNVLSLSQPFGLVPGSYTNTNLTVDATGRITAISNGSGGGGGTGTVTSITAGVGIGAPAAAGVITTSGTINLLPATTSTLGGVIVGTGLSVNNGVLSVSGGGGGGLQTRITVTGTTDSVANLAITNLNIEGFRSYALMQINCDGAAWVRIYSDPTARTNDATRNIGNDPTPGSGVIAEATFTAPATPARITPFTYGGNLENPVTNTIYLAVQNLSGAARSFTVSLTLLQLES